MSITSCQQDQLNPVNSMNTTSLLKPAGLSLGLVLAAVVPGTAVAGPGPQYWAAQGKPKADSVVSATKADASPAKLCDGAEVVATATLKPGLPNGKGPLVSVPTGTKTVCHMCPVTTLVPKNSFGNGKGQMTFSQVTKTGPEHNCAKCTGNPAKT